VSGGPTGPPKFTSFENFFYAFSCHSPHSLTLLMEFDEALRARFRGDDEWTGVSLRARIASSGVKGYTCHGDCRKKASFH
jgi:hypothetical protein